MLKGVISLEELSFVKRPRAKVAYVSSFLPLLNCPKFQVPPPPSVVVCAFSYLQKPS